MNKTRGLVLVNTGPGKGKTTAALGQALRASGQGLKVLILQFIKARPTGEAKALENLPNVEFKQTGSGMFVRRAITPKDKEKAALALAEARASAASGRYDMIILDEICVALYRGLLEVNDVLDFIKNKPENIHLILTGRYCPEEIMEAADLVTVMEAGKHHHQAGIEAQAGIEY